jgi:hypothetical protein
MRKATLLSIALLGLGLASLAQAEVTQRGGMRIAFGGEISPKKLPRHGSAPVRVSVSAEIASTRKGKNPPQLQRIEIAINRHGILDPTGLPTCEVEDIQPATTENALEACRGSLVGHGSFSARVLLPEQAPFPSTGRIYAFNGTYKGRPAILAHVYGTNPAPTSITLPFTISRSGGAFATTLRASLPRVTSEWGYVTGLELTLDRRYVYRGRVRSFVSASCPAPPNLPGAVFSFARARFGFEGRTVSPPPLVRNCKARG